MVEITTPAEKGVINHYLKHQRGFQAIPLK
jgi:hypothetical protein